MENLMNMSFLRETEVDIIPSIGVATMGHTGVGYWCKLI